MRLTAGTADINQFTDFIAAHPFQEVVIDITVTNPGDPAFLDARPTDDPAYLFVCGAGRYGGGMCGDGAEILIHGLTAVPDASLDQQHGEWRLQGRFAVQADGGVHQGIASINLRPVAA